MLFTAGTGYQCRPWSLRRRWHHCHHIIFFTTNCSPQEPRTRIAPGRREDGCVAAPTIVGSSLRQLGPRIAPGPPEDGGITATVCVRQPGTRIAHGPREDGCIFAPVCMLFTTRVVYVSVYLVVRIAASPREDDHVAATVRSILFTARAGYASYRSRSARRRPHYCYRMFFTAGTGYACIPLLIPAKTVAQLQS